MGYCKRQIIDLTENTNIEKWPKLFVVAKDADGEKFVIMRVFMPHQHKWMFQWILVFHS